ncbi:MAG: tetratricopeptide repeat protein [Lachnospiraceae bacterium]|nr:tetratricopeptide repeat protein [Lachnospiraceae bacterium]
MRLFNRFTSVLALLLVVSLLAGSVESLANTTDGNHYTYTYDCWGYDRESPDAYSVTRTITGSDYPCGNFKDPQGLYVVGTETYVVDTGNSRIVHFTYRDDTFQYVDEISEYTDLQGNKVQLKNPEDCYVTEDGEVYIADTGNDKIVHLDSDRKAIKTIGRPDDQTYDQESFLPEKLVVDKSNRIFAQVKNINKGFMEFDSQGTFTGYVGASEVTYDFLTYLWKLVATKEQREQMVQFVPTEYSNLCLDSEGFIYATISVFDGAVESAQPIRKLNVKGTDILVRNGYEDPYGDLRYTDGGEMKGPSKFCDITCLDNDVYYALDKTKGRVFAYDFQGNMLYAFGGHGYKAGYFMNPSAIEDLGDSLLVMDQNLGTITQFTLTEYGKLINEGLSLYKQGDYDGSAETWERVLKLNGNYDQAYIGIGRALLRQNHYKEAMDYFELKLDTTNYSKAYQLYRKEWFEDNIGIIIALLVIIVLLCLGIGFVKKARKEVEKG